MFEHRSFSPIITFIIGISLLISACTSAIATTTAMLIGTETATATVVPTGAFVPTNSENPPGVASPENAYPPPPIAYTDVPVSYPVPADEPGDAAKATSRARMALVMTARPAPTSTPTIPANAQPCAASDFAGEAGAMGATGSIAFGVLFTNMSDRVCTLQGPPDIQLVDRNGQPLDIRYYPHCFLCNKPEYDYETPLPATQAALAPTHTAVVEKLLYGKIGVGPGESIRVFLIWDNWCQPFPEEGVWVRLTLPGELGQLEVPTDAYVGGRCDAPTAQSSLMISHFHR